MVTHQMPRPPGRNRTLRRISVAVIAVCAVVIVAAATATALGGKPQTAVQRCTSAYQALVSAGLYGDKPGEVRQDGTAADVRMLDAAQKACDRLTPAQARQAARAVTP